MSPTLDSAEQCHLETFNTSTLGTDHFDYWGSTAGVIEQVASVSQYGGCKDDGFGCGWNYADFVMTGGQGCADGVAGHRCPGMTDTEYITEATLWTIVASPLIVATGEPKFTLG